MNPTRMSIIFSKLLKRKNTETKGIKIKLLIENSILLKKFFCLKNKLLIFFREHSVITVSF